MEEDKILLSIQLAKAYISSLKTCNQNAWLFFGLVTLIANKSGKITEIIIYIERISY